MAPVRGALAFLASLLFPLAAAAHEFVATVTLVEGTNAIISGVHGYLPAAGVRLRHSDIIQTGAKALMQVEIDDGGMIELGPETRFLADLPYRRGEAPVIGPHFLLAGWVKLTVPKRAEGPPHRINTPYFDLVINSGIAVLQVTADGAQFFVESGEGLVLGPAGHSITTAVVRTGRMYSRKAAQPTGALADRPAPTFVKGMPPAFRDTLPPRLAKLKLRDLEPKPGPEYTYQDVEDWLKGDLEVRRALVPLMRTKAKDPDFRAALIENMLDHPEWNAILGR
jgi:FecR protein